MSFAQPSQWMPGMETVVYIREVEEGQRKNIVRIEPVMIPRSAIAIPNHGFDWLTTGKFDPFGELMACWFPAVPDGTA